jgi:protein-S-isoprenylcysteine O-methyltransferase Ste14
MMRFTFALALLRNNAPALLCAAIATVGLWLWSRVEERDLPALDADYAEYRRRVPAFFVPRPVRFWRYLLTGKDTRQGQEPVPATKIDSPF